MTAQNAVLLLKAIVSELECYDDAFDRHSGWKHNLECHLELDDEGYEYHEDDEPESPEWAPDTSAAACTCGLGAAWRALQLAREALREAGTP